MFVRRCAVVAGVSLAIKICSSRHGCRYRRKPERDVHLHMHLAGRIVLPKRLLADSPHFQSCYQIFRGIFLDKIAVLD